MANNLPRDITAAQNEIGRLQNQLNHVQISLAASRFSRTTDRQEYNRRINELKQKLEQQQEMINNLISVIFFGRNFRYEIFSYVKLIYVV
ncbi:unnamed protein product [Rotaria socialis]